MNADSALNAPDRSTDLNPVHQACERFEQAWRAGQSPRIETFLGAAEAGAQSELFKKLLRLDFAYRSKAGEQPSQADYLQRFPAYAQAITITFVIDSDSRTILYESHPRQADPAEFQPGDRIEEFEIREKLGSGAFGCVYRAWQHRLEREVALKLSTMKSHESLNMARLDGHPNIVRIYDERHVPDLQLHLVYMELVPGVTLRDVISRVRNQDGTAKSDRTLARLIAECQPDNRPTTLLPIEETSVEEKSQSTTIRPLDREVCRIGAQLANALEFAHRRNVLHCDVKPANIVLDAQGNPKLVDFNVAHRTNLIPDYLGGTFAYMSPEQLDSFTRSVKSPGLKERPSLDGRSDIYSLGIVLWELLTGSPPFVEGTDHQDRATTFTNMAENRRAWSPSRALTTLPASVPAGIQQVLLRCLQPRPEDRYQTAGELARELTLAAQPDLQELLFPPADWRSAALKRPFAAVMLTALGCNLTLSALNILYNWEIIFKIQELQYFWIMVVWVNTIGIGLGLLTGLVVCWPVSRALKSLRNGTSIQADDPAIVRSLTIGHLSAVVIFTIWAASSVVWVVWMSRMRGLVDMKTVHFAGSVILSGSIAAALTFLTVTFVSVRVFLPRLIRERFAVPQNTLDRRIERYSALLRICPLLAVLMFFFATEHFSSVTYVIVWFVILYEIWSRVGLPAARQIRADLSLLSRLSSRSSGR